MSSLASKTDSRHNPDLQQMDISRQVKIFYFIICCVGCPTVHGSLHDIQKAKSFHFYINQNEEVSWK